MATPLFSRRNVYFADGVGVTDTGSKHGLELLGWGAEIVAGPTTESVRSNRTISL
jgi:hypothetical protein